MIGKNLTWTKKQIADALKANRIAGIAAVNLTVQFVLHNGLDRGVLVQQSGAIKRFESDTATWNYVDRIKRERSYGTRSA